MKAWVPMLLLWVAAGAAGCAAGGPASSDRGAKARTRGQELLARRCHSCHEVPEPGSYSSREWGLKLGKMRRRVHLPAADWDTLAALVPGAEMPSPRGGSTGAAADPAGTIGR